MTLAHSNSVAIIPEEYFLRPEGVQFKKSFATQPEAVEYARQRGYRLVITCEAEGRYYVLHDPGPQAGKFDSEFAERGKELLDKSL